MTEMPAGEGWALPGSAVDPQSPGAGGAPAAVGGSPEGVPTLRPANGHPEEAPDMDGVGGLLSTGAADVAVPRIDLRPMTAAEIVDGAFEVVRARALRILGFTAVLVTPVHLLLAFWQRDATGGVGLWGFLAGSEEPQTQQALEDEPTGLEDMVQLLSGAVLSGLVLAAVAVAIAYQMGSWVAGRDAPLGELAAVVGRRAWPILASWVLVHLAEVPALLFCLIPVFFVMPYFVAVAPVIGAERVGPITALKRSMRLASARYWPVFGVTLLTGAIAVVLGLVLSSWLALPIGIWGWDVAWPMVGLANIMSSVVTTPFVAAAAVLVYLDLRVRTEGLDIELAVRETFAEARS